MLHKNCILGEIIYLEAGSGIPDVAALLIWRLRLKEKAGGLVIRSFDSDSLNPSSPGPSSIQAVFDGSQIFEFVDEQVVHPGLSARLEISKIIFKGHKVPSSINNNHYIYSEIPLLRPPKITTLYTLKILFARLKSFSSSFSTPSVSLIRDHLWDCPKVVFKTTFGQSQRWS